MEYKSASFAILGLLGLLFWALEYWKVLKTPELVAPTNLKVGGANMLRGMVFLLGVAGWLLISYSMTGPRKALKFIPSNIEVNDIFFVVDVSRSMLADDMQPNRLEVAKEKLREFAKLRPTARVGVIIFSEKVFTMLPLTTDPTLVDKILSDIQVGFLGSGTNIGDGLALAVARAQDSKTKNKVVILLTDGVNNVGKVTPIQAAELAKENDIRVYTITLGTRSDAKIPVGKGMFGTQYQTIPGGSFDLKTMKEISDMTNGKSYMADSEESLKEILGEIQSLEKTEIKSANQVVYDELFHKYLLWGVLLLAGCELTRRNLLKEVS
ncbi:MAG: aerotolerance regulator BatA [Halobacteriovoraceae bacterium]|nr:aerotolerance regulator BatA [Halobacteriovoraceae bacterium]